MALLRGLTRPTIANRKRCAHLLVSRLMQKWLLSQVRSSYSPHYVCLTGCEVACFGLALAEKQLSPKWTMQKNSWQDSRAFDWIAAE